LKKPLISGGKGQGTLCRFAFWRNVNGEAD